MTLRDALMVDLASLAVECESRCDDSGILFHI